MLFGVRKSNGVPSTSVKLPSGIRFPSVAIILVELICTICAVRSCVSLYASRFQNWCAESNIGVRDVALAEMDILNTELLLSEYVTCRSASAPKHKDDIVPETGYIPW